MQPRKIMLMFACITSACAGCTSSARAGWSGNWDALPSQDPVFARVAEAVPGIGDDESEEEFDLAAMMAKQRAQAASLHQEAQKLRTTSDTCASGCLSADLLHT